MRVAWRNDAQGAELGRSGGRARTPAAPTAEAYPDWDAIYADNVGRIYRLLFAKVGNRPDAEDLTSQVFLAAFGPLRTTASVGEVRSYLLAAARTVLAAHWRSTLGHQVTVIDPAGIDLTAFAGLPDVDRPEDMGVPREPDAQSEEARLRAERILSELPERQRRILMLRFLEGCSVKEAAAELGVTVANAKVLQHRALRRAAGLDWEADRKGETP
jgi:RNA polymerase sigma-70 factor (ECF subfamily)